LERVDHRPVRDPREGTTHYISVQRDVTVQKELEEQVWFLAHHDPETRLPNRNLLNLRLTEAIDRASHSSGAVAVGIVDLDDFRTVNTSFDHQTGDQVIDETARRLKGQVRRTDFVARIGGDKFAVIIDNLDTVRADDQIRATMSHVNKVVEEPFRLPSGQEVSIGMSMGLAVFPRDGDTPGTLLHHADTALHAVKLAKNDRNQWWNTGTKAAAPNETTTTGQAVDTAGLAVGQRAEPSRIHQLVAELQAETLSLIDIRRSTRDKRQHSTDEAAFEWIQQTLEDLTATFIGISGANRGYPL
jgi:diguanylate cyclase (GGDEF)-like protein